MGQSIGKHVICISSRCMGEGDNSLGELLMKAFVNNLAKIEILPSHIIFYQSGIFLALQDSSVIDSLLELEKKGVQILSCGTCLDFYEKKSFLGAGVVSNMHDIVNYLTHASHVIYP